MKFAGYVGLVVLGKHCKLGGQICYNSVDVEFIVGDSYWCTVYVVCKHWQL